MSEMVDPETGEVVQTPIDLVPLVLGDMSEDSVLAVLPTPAQASMALQKARAVNSRMPRVLDEHRGRLQVAERDLKLSIALEVKSLREEHAKATLTELRELATASDRVQTALDARDTAWLLFEYVKDWGKSIERDIDLLRSINANTRPEHRS